MSDNTSTKKTSLDKAKEKIFFEKQEGRLCAQHCLNNALQSSMFNAVDLSQIAQDLDELERRRMSEFGVNTQEYLDFMNRPSENYDDSGYFSVQVLSEALKNVNLELVNWKSEDERAVEARKQPERERLYICHMEDHWLSIRRLGPQWVDLNSMLKEPKLLSDTYLGVYLHTLEMEGYLIFVVFGELPECEAEDAFRTLKRDADGKYIEELAGHRLGTADSEDDEALLRRGIEMSLASSPADAIRRQRESFLQRLIPKETNDVL